MLSAAQGSYDVVVLGSGISGLATALAAHERGLQVLVLEKDDKLGGGTTKSAGTHLGRGQSSGAGSRLRRLPR